ncbi:MULTISPECIES: DUF397 domain-containing protein [Actinomadura]|uniref:DUF397 domain-containing protein n=1 Tax=Actinomadura yumaensis TaxID=111807 RepID=A0ABW2CUF9_9ACTN|nr:DUF397 domain-containing protein [Actinomadura sp. J1-007]MWK35993.1 DUF397 domain-containing protein [Actinomadura sp. J1-007]
MIQWRKSSHSQGQGEGECVEVSVNVAGCTLVRDSKDVEGPRLMLGRSELAGLVARVKAGEFDL